MTIDPSEGTRELGVSFFGIVEPAGKPCEQCGERPGVPQRCEGDGADHRHGMVHTAPRDGQYRGDLAWLCEACGDNDRQAWQAARAAR